MTLTHYRRRLGQVRADFERNTAGHELVVLADRSTDAVDPQPYRHLRLAAPGTRMYSWDIVTWPGHLATTGDIADGYTFARVHDMVDFFTPEPEPYRINPEYWAEKLACSQREHAKVFSLESLLEAMDADIDECAQEYGMLAHWRPEWVQMLKDRARQEVSEATEYGDSSTRADAAYSALRTFEYTADSLVLDIASSPEFPGPRGAEKTMPLRGSLQPFSFDRNGDAYELMSSAYEYDYHLLLAMHAVVRGLEMYRAQL